MTLNSCETFALQLFIVFRFQVWFVEIPILYRLFVSNKKLTLFLAVVIFLFSNMYNFFILLLLFEFSKLHVFLK
jgi:hypothetical protein